jgi:hypothetical protein
VSVSQKCAACGQRIPQGDPYVVLRDLEGSEAGGDARGYYHTHTRCQGAARKLYDEDPASRILGLHFEGVPKGSFADAEAISP